MTLHTPHYVFGYGSLLSHDSRLRHSSIDTQVIPATLRGWQRTWHTRHVDEKQTYVGATSLDSGSINGVLVPTGEIAPSLRQREINYRFSPISISQLDFPIALSAELTAHLLQAQLWVCETLLTHNADHHFPVYQSYVDTCLIGCLEAGEEDFAMSFIQSTQGWEWGWVNDRHAPMYPRSANVAAQQLGLIDQLLDAFGILKHRREP